MRRVFNLFLMTLLLGVLANSLTFGKSEIANAANTDLAMAKPQLYLLGAVIDASAASSAARQQDEANILDPKRIRIINLGPIVNWKGLDYAPTISADGRTLYYVSDRPGSKLKADGDFSHDFWASKKAHRLDTIFFEPYNIDETTHLGTLGVNTELNEGAASIAADGQTLYFTGCNRPDGLGDCDIYRTTIEGDKWGKPINLGPNVNSPYWDSQPSIAPDQSRLYFASTRPGPNSDGKGNLKNMDIWYSDWDDDLEEWKPALNLEELNTRNQDWTPFIAADNTTLFFSSNGHKPSVGGLDFYFARFDASTGKFGQPINLGEPINTKENEAFITLPAAGDVLYFSSERKDLAGYQGSYDIFMAFVPTFFKAVNVRVIVVDECSQENIPATISIRNPITNRVISDSLTIYRHQIDLVVSNTDYGNPKDSNEFVDLEITATNPKYGKVSTVQRIEKPSTTYKAEEADTFADEITITLTMGQRPVLGSIVEQGDFIERTKNIRPELAKFDGLVMEQIQTWDLYPLLNYVFFDLGSSSIPNRYILFDSPNKTNMFTDTTIAGGTLDKYYHILNIYGFRLNKYPNAKIEIVGCNDGTTPEEKRAGLSKERAQVVFDYLKNVWKIDESRMKISHRDKPQVVSNLKDSLGIVENRRVEILCTDWDIMKPVFEKDPKTMPQPETMFFTLKNGIEDELIVSRRIEVTRGGQTWQTLTDVGLTDPQYLWDWLNDDFEYPKNEVPYIAQLIVRTATGAECKSDPITIPVMQVSTEEKKVEIGGDSTLERYNLILFPFDRADTGPINERIMRDYVYERVKPTSSVQVIGHTDVVGLYDHNKRLSERRANTVTAGIDKVTKGRYGKLLKRGVGEDDPLYTNATPEGRFYNRTVQVIIRTPVEEWD